MTGGFLCTGSRIESPLALGGASSCPRRCRVPWRAEARVSVSANQPGFTFDGLQAGEYALTAARSGDGIILAASGPLRLGEGELRRVSLTPFTGDVLEVRVMTPSGEPIGDARCSLRPANGTPPGRVAATDAAGVARFERVPSGPYSLGAGASERVEARTSIEVTDGARDVTLTLEEASWLVVEVLAARDPEAADSTILTGDTLRLAAVVLDGDDPGWAGIEAGTGRPMEAVAFGRYARARDAFAIKTRPGRYRLRLDLARPEAPFDAPPLLRREEDVVVPASGTTARVRLEIP